MIFLIVLIWLFYPVSIFAAPQISITNYPESVLVGDTFPLIFNVSAAEIGTTYHYKAVGDSSTDISIYPACANRYDDCFNLIILNLDSNTATTYAKINTANNLNKIKIRIAQSDKHSSVFDSPYINIVSFVSPEPTAKMNTPTPTPFDTPKPTAPTVTIIPSPVVSPEPTVKAELVLSEIMANPESDQNEWVEIYNPSENVISLKKLCFYDASSHSRCFSDGETIGPYSYYSHSFSSGFLNNDGDTVTFLSNTVTYPKSPKNISYSRQENGSWCFAGPSQNSSNQSCTDPVDDDSSSENKYPLPLLSLQFIPDSVTAGDDFNLVFNLKSDEQFSLRIISPFGSSYFPFSDFHDGYSWLTMSLSIPKKTPAGNYPLSFHLKKAGSSHLYDYQLGNLNVKSAVVTPKVSRSKVLGISNNYCPSVNPSPIITDCPLSNTISTVLPDANFFSWPFLFVGSILFLSPILFPKLYSV